MSYLTIKSVFEEVCRNLHFDHKLYHKVCDMEARFVNKKHEHIEFFGGNLTGVQVVRFTDSDKDKLFIDILDADEAVLEEKIYGVKDIHQKHVINQDWVVTSDIFNISSIWLMHAFHHSTELDENQRQEAKTRVCMYLMYKFLTSLLFRYFKFPADPDVAKATYAQLSYKYALKQCGSWGATIRQLAENVTAKDSIHFNTINIMDDSRLNYMIGDVQGHIRDMLKNIYSEFIKIHKQGVKISSSSSLIEVKGSVILKDNTKNPGIYNRYLKGIISDKNTFIKQELIDVISGIMHTMSPRLLLQTLEWTSDNYQHSKDGNIDKAIDIVLEHALAYITADGISHNDIAMLIDKLRGAYMSSRSTDPLLLEARALVEKIVKLATGSHNESGIAAVRTGVMIYWVMRSYCMRYYSNK